MRSQDLDTALTLSLRVGRGLCFFLALVTLSCTSVNGQTPRPKILGVAVVSVAASPPQEAMSFYEQALGLLWRSTTCASVCIVDFEINPAQHLSVGVGHPSSTTKEDLSQAASFSVIFQTANAKGMREFLTGHGIKCSGFFQNIGFSDSTAFYLDDPEGHRIGFLELRGVRSLTAVATPVSNRLIHAGFIVKDRVVEEHFYKDILGFRPYWHGGRKDDGVDDWASFQVPDGTDWIEFMLNVPDNADKHLRGVMNHIALGVTDIQTAKAQLIKNSLTLKEEPKIGRDGKWQLNVYDPDETRIEFMEFTPKGKTCCSEFTAPHPKP